MGVINVTIREEVLNLLQEISDIRVSQKELKQKIKDAEIEELPAKEIRNEKGNEQAKRYKDIISKYELTSTKVGNGMVMNVDLYGAILFRLVYDDNKKTISYGLTTKAKEFVGWDSSQIIDEIEKYIASEFPFLREQLAELQVKKNQYEYLLARSLAEYSLTSFLDFKVRKRIRKEIDEARENLVRLKKLIAPIEKRANRLSDPKMKDLLVEVYQVQSALKDCLKYEPEYSKAWEEWKSKKSNIQLLRMKEEELRQTEATFISELIMNSDTMSELINVSKSPKVASRTRSLAKEIVKTAAQKTTVTNVIKRI